MKEEELSFFRENIDLLPDVFFLLVVDFLENILPLEELFDPPDDLLDFLDEPDGLLFFNSFLHCLSES